MPPEYAPKEEYEKLKGEYKKLKSELKEDYERFESDELLKLRNQFQEHIAWYEEREKKQEKLINRPRTERLMYISIIIVAVTLLVSVTSM
jgi:hypothetical protein